MRRLGSRSMMFRALWIWQRWIAVLRPKLRRIAHASAFEPSMMNKRAAGSKTGPLDVRSRRKPTRSKSGRTSVRQITPGCDRPRSRSRTWSSRSAGRRVISTHFRNSCAPCRRLPPAGHVTGTWSTLLPSNFSAHDTSSTTAYTETKSATANIANAYWQRLRASGTFLCRRVWGREPEHDREPC